MNFLHAGGAQYLQECVRWRSALSGYQDVILSGPLDKLSISFHYIQIHKHELGEKSVFYCYSIKVMVVLKKTKTKLNGKQNHILLSVF